MTTTIPKIKRYVPNGEVGQRVSRAKSLKHQIDQLKIAYEIERQWIKSFMESRAIKNLYCGDINCCFVTKHKWTYSPQLEREMLKIRNDQENEKKENKAMDSPSHHVQITFKHRE